MSRTDPLWPKRADGSPKTLGEMTKEERDFQWKRAADKASTHFEDPTVKANIKRVLETP
jgi:hypothetical protein